MQWRQIESVRFSRKHLMAIQIYVQVIKNTKWTVSDLFITSLKKYSKEHHKN